MNFWYIWFLPAVCAGGNGFLAAVLQRSKKQLPAIALPMPAKSMLMKKNDSGAFQGVNGSATIAGPLAASLKRYRWLITWCLFHLCALLLSYRGVPFFNNSGEPKTDKFWPFVKFTNTYFMPDNNSNYSKFNGLFTEYDWTEFSFYSGVVIFVMLLIYVNKKAS